ncbi:MAG: hypothetical protein AAF541_00725 [Pseudomonadota bacterium]
MTLFYALRVSICILLLSITGVSGCSNQPPATEPAPEPSPVATQPKIAQETLFRLLDEADQAVRREHLTFPKRGSALAIYTQILSLDPEQEDAIRGLEHLVEKYIALSIAALEREQYATARSMLARARIILPHHPSIEPTAAQIRLLREADRVKVTLSRKLIGDEAQLERALADLFADAAEDTDDAGACRYKIWASSDRSGRVVYQALSRVYAQSIGKSQADAPRLKAQLAIRSPGGVEKICFNPTT